MSEAVAMAPDGWQLLGDDRGRVAVPADWRQVHGDLARLGAAFVLGGPVVDGFAPTVVVTRADVPPGTGLPGWSAGLLAGVRETLRSFHLLDELPDTVAGHEAVARLGVYGLDQRSLSVVSWAWLAGSEGITLTATCPTSGYPDLAGLAGPIAHSYAEGER